jgi:lysophospholipase L1-like esterase
VAALSLGEIGARALGLAPDLHRIRPSSLESSYRWSENPLLGYELKPDYWNPRADLHESFPSINSHGQRDIERTVGKKPDSRRIVVLGDSVVAGHGIQDVRETIPLQLQRMLEGEDTEVLNFGVGGYCTMAEVELLESKGLDFEPDVVVLVFVSDDFSDFNVQFGRYPVPRPAFAEWLFVHSHLYRRVSLMFDWYRFRTETSVEAARERNETALGGSNVERGLERLRRLSEEHGFRTVVAIWPWFLDEGIYDFGDESDDREVDREESGERAVIHLKRDLTKQGGPLEVEEIAARIGLPTYRLSDYFKRDLADRDQRERRRHSARTLYTIGDQVHPSETGARVAAAALREILDRE